MQVITELQRRGGGRLKKHATTKSKFLCFIIKKLFECVI